MAGPQRSVLREGIVAGLIGAAVVALWFFVYDIARGTPFRTPTLLGAFVFFGIQTPTGLDPAAGLILGYTVLHGLAFIAFGVIAASLMGSWGAVIREGVLAGLIGAAVVALWFFAIDAIHGEMLRTPTLLGSALLRQQTPLNAVLFSTVVHGVAFVMFGIIGAFLIAGSWVLDELAGWTVFVGNVLAAAAMLAFYFRRHRGLAHRLAAAWEADDTSRAERAAYADQGGHLRR